MWTKKTFNKFVVKLIDSKRMDLIYRGSRDGFKASDFHSKCDEKGDTITFVKNSKGAVFGGFTKVPWS